MMGNMFIDLFSGKCEYLSEEEIEEKMEEAEHVRKLIKKPEKTQAELEKEREDDFILKTKMRLQKNELLVPFVQEFIMDDYHKENTDIPSELERDVRKLKRRYPNFNEYQSAMAIYYEYMEYLYNKYGGKELFLLKDKGNFIDDYVPPLPKIKTTAINKMLLKKQIVLSPKQKGADAICIDELTYEDILNSTSTTDADIDYDDYDVVKEIKESKDMSKLLTAVEHGSKMSRKSEVAMLRSSSAIEFLDEYFQQKNKLYKEEEREVMSDDLTLQDLIDDNYITEEDIKNSQEERVYTNGRVIPKSQADELAVYNMLRDLGWDTVKIAKRLTGTCDTDIVYRRLKNIDKKEKKKNKKNAKNKKSDFTSTLSFNNGYDDFATFAEDILNFSADNIFKD